jgi:hypothetical protein
MKVLFYPQWISLLENRLFSGKTILGSYPSQPYHYLRNQAAKEGIELNTWDLDDPKSVDLIVIQDLPYQKSKLELLLMAAPQAKKILQILESPLRGPEIFNHKNHRWFDAVLTYNYEQVDNKKYFQYFLPIAFPPQNVEFIPFHKRKPLVMVNSNKRAGFLTPRGNDLLGRLGLRGVKANGWCCSISDFLFQWRGELYSHRRKVARIAEKLGGDIFDIYGNNWSGTPLAYHHRLFPMKPFKASKGSLSGEKLGVLKNYRFTLAFENYQGQKGYISEKIFDALYAGSVPIYLGDRRISDYIWPECFIDARNFESYLELLKYVQACPEKEWLKMYCSGQKFIRSQDAKKFQPDAFSKCFLSLIKQLFQL